MISLEVLRHIRGDGHGVQLGALPEDDPGEETQSELAEAVC